MKFGVLFFIIASVFAHIDETNRIKRGASGALHIVTNHAQPIHADVKSETPAGNSEKTGEQKCKSKGPDHVEPGIGFKVTSPDDAVTTYEVKSLRKSLPISPPTTLTLIRSVSRVVALVVLFVSAILESYPTFYGLICTIFSFLDPK